MLEVEAHSLSQAKFVPSEFQISQSSKSYLPMLLRRVNLRIAPAVCASCVRSDQESSITKILGDKFFGVEVTSPSVLINCDMSEGFGLYKFGRDEDLSPFIHLANIGCGFHGSDANHMRAGVKLAKRFGVAVGAHPSLPDLQGFGRREMQIEREELANLLIYQVGALVGILQAEGVALNHIKPHGALYGMAARQVHVAEAICDAADVFHVPLLGLAGTLHEEVFTRRGHVMLAEFFADLEYDDDSRLLITREHPPVSPEWAAERCLGAVRQGVFKSRNGRNLPVRVQTICVHSDTPNAVEVVKAIASALETSP